MNIQYSAEVAALIHIKSHYPTIVQVRLLQMKLRVQLLSVQKIWSTYKGSYERLKIMDGWQAIRHNYRSLVDTSSNAKRG